MRGLLSWFPKVEILYAGKGYGWHDVVKSRRDAHADGECETDIVCVHPHGLFVIGGILFMMHDILQRLERSLTLSLDLELDKSKYGKKIQSPYHCSIIAAPFVASPV